MSWEYPQDGLALEIKAHWKEHRPRMYRELEKAGQLDQAIFEASERTGQAFAEQVEHGLPAPSAWEAVRELWCVPAERGERAGAAGRAEPTAGAGGADAGALLRRAQSGRARPDEGT